MFQPRFRAPLGAFCVPGAMGLFSRNSTLNMKEKELTTSSAGGACAAAKDSKANGMQVVNVFAKNAFDDTYSPSSATISHTSASSPSAMTTRCTPRSKASPSR